MKRPTMHLSMIATAFLLASVIFGLAVFAQERDPCRNSSVEVATCSVHGCSAVDSPTLAPQDGPRPTPAPPRPESVAMDARSTRSAGNAQPVFLKVETDRNDLIEVEIASP